MKWSPFLKIIFPCVNTDADVRVAAVVIVVGVVDLDQLADLSIAFCSSFYLAARSPIFVHLRMGTFGKSAYFRAPKNGTSSA